MAESRGETLTRSRRRTARCCAALLPALNVLAACEAGALGNSLPAPSIQEAQSATAGPVIVTAVADVTAVAPGSTFHLVVRLSIERGWHVYWKNAGESGGSTELRVEAPGSFEVEPARYPVPVAIAEASGTVYGYADEAVFFVPVRAPSAVADDVARFRIDVDYLVCRAECRMGSASLEVSVPVASDRSGAAAEADIDWLEAGRARLPRPLSDVPEASATDHGDRLVIAGPALGDDQVVLYPDPSPGVSFGRPRERRDGGRFEVTIPYTFVARNALGRPPVASGVLAFGTDRDAPGIEFTAALARAPREP